MRLFDEKGYYNTTIDDVGGELGITGPALYRYFRSKSEILVAAFDSTMEYLLGQFEGAAPRTLDEMIDLHLEYVLGHRHMMHIVRREVHHLPQTDHRRFRRRQQAYLDVFAAALRHERPELNQEQAHVVVTGVVNLMNEFARRRNELEGTELRAIVSAMARAASHIEMPVVTKVEA